MSTVPLIASASDIPRALRHADRHVGSRAYVARKLSAMGQAHQIPASWGLTAAGPSAAVREKAADKGQALPDGSYPIRNKADLHRAIRAFGRAKDKAAAKRHIIKRARALGAASELPGDWGVTAAVVAAGWDNRLHPRGRDGRFIEKFGILDLFDGIDFDKPSARGEAVGLRNENGKDIITVRVTKVQPGSSRKVGEEVDLEPNRVASAPDAKATVRPDKVAKGDIIRAKNTGQEKPVESVDDDGVTVITDDGEIFGPGEYDMARRRARPDEAGDDSDVVPGPPPAKPDTAPSAKFGEGDVVRVPDGSTITVSSVDDENGTVTGARADGHSVTVPAEGLEMARRKRRETDTDKIEPSKMKTDGPAVITSPKVNQGPPDPKSPDYVDAEMLDAQLRQSLAELGIDPDAPAGDAPEGEVNVEEGEDGEYLYNGVPYIPNGDGTWEDYDGNPATPEINESLNDAEANSPNQPDGDEDSYDLGDDSEYEAYADDMKAADNPDELIEAYLKGNDLEDDVQAITHDGGYEREELISQLVDNQDLSRDNAEAAINDWLERNGDAYGAPPADDHGISDDLGDEPAPLTPEEDAFEAPDATPEDAEYIDYEAKVLYAARSAGATDEQISNMFEGDLEAAFMDEMQAGEDPEVVGKALAADLADMDAENAPEAELSPAERLGITQEQYDSYSPWERSLVAKNNLGVGKSRSDEDAAKLLDDETLQALVDFQFTPEADKAVFQAELDSRGGGGTPGDGNSSALQKYEDLANSGSRADALAALSEDELRELASDTSIPNSSRAKFDRELERRDAASAADDAQAWLDGYAGRDLTEIAGNLEEAAADSKGNSERRKALTEWVEGYLDDEESAAADPEGWEALRQTANKELGLQYEAGDSTEPAPDASNSSGTLGKVDQAVKDGDTPLLLAAEKKLLKDGVPQEQVDAYMRLRQDIKKSPAGDYRDRLQVRADKVRNAIESGDAEYRDNPDAGLPDAGGTPEAPSPSTPSADSADAKAIRLSLTNSSTGKGIELDPARVDAVFANPDHGAGHKDLAKMMTELKLGGKQRKRLRELLDRHYGVDPASSDSAAVQAQEVADGLSPDNPLKAKLAEKAAAALPEGAPDTPGSNDRDAAIGKLPPTGQVYVDSKGGGGEVYIYPNGAVKYNAGGGVFKNLGKADADRIKDDWYAASKDAELESGGEVGDAFNTGPITPINDNTYEINGIDFKYQGDGVWTDGDGTPGVRPDIVARLQERYDADHNLPAAEAATEAPTAPSAPESPAPAPQAAESPSVGADDTFPAPQPGAKMYQHPMGARIYVNPDGSMEAYGKDGKKKSTSATPEKLAAGHGQWKEVPFAGQESVGSQAPTKPDFEGAYAGVLDGKSQADGLRDLVAARKARIAEIDKELDGFMKGVTLGPLAQKNRDALYDERSKLEKEASALDRKRRVIAPTQAEVLQDLNDYDPSDEEPPNIDLSTAISAFSAELSKDGPDAPTYLAKINGVEVSLSNAQVKALLGKA